MSYHEQQEINHLILEQISILEYVRSRLGKHLGARELSVLRAKLVYERELYRALLESTVYREASLNAASAMPSPMVLPMTPCPGCGVGEGLLHKEDCPVYLEKVGGEK